MNTYFENFDLKAFWDEDDELPKKLTDEMVEKAEKKLGYKLPKSFIELLKSRNGGYPINTCFPTSEKTSWAEDHIEIETIFGIGVEDSIDDEYGSNYLIEEWEYPAIGIVICRCPSAGHDTVMLDYSECGKEGEPKVVHIDTETENGEPKVTVLAQDFATFIKGLKPDTEFEDTPEPTTSPKIVSATYSDDFLTMVEKFKEKTK
jgi:hypothetical protein